MNRIGKTLKQLLLVTLFTSFNATVAATEISYYHTDHLGTPQVMTDDSGAIVWQADYDPFGKATVTTETVTNNVRFPGQYFDVETGLHYNYFRTYDPTIGRYITSDPIGLEGGLNTYLYTNANPIRFIDPEGLASCEGRWVKVRWTRNIGSVYTLSCTCWWSCTSCPPIGDAFPVPNLGQFTSEGKIIFSGKPGVDTNPEEGDACLCGEPGPAKGCEPCKE